MASSRILWLLLLALPLSLKAQVIGPLLKTEWHQYEPYNNLCPEIGGERTIVGCVATALTEVMYVYRYPAATRDTLHGWSNDQYAIGDILPGAPIAWHDILSDYRGQYTDAQATAVARLSLYAGMACQMNYGVGASGADTWRYVETLPTVFGYEYVNMYDRMYYSPHQWRQALVHELQQGHPLLYTGFNQTFGGHAFVVDGYDASTGRFHTGWGYGGAYNGWFDIDVLNPFESPHDPTPWGRREGFFCNQSALALAPTPCRAYQADTVRLDVRLDSVTLSPLAKGSGSYALFHFTSQSPDTLSYTYEVLSNAPGDTALFEQADYIGLSTVALPPYSHATDTVLLRIKQAGERLLRVSDDDVTTTQPLPISISPQSATVTVGAIELIDLTPTTATFTAPVEGTGLVTWCLFPDASCPPDSDTRHWSIQQDTVTFTGLVPNHEYTLILRQPWTIRQRYTFTTSSDTSVGSPGQKGPDSGRETYDLSGRRTTPHRHQRILIDNGRKIVR